MGSFNSTDGLDLVFIIGSVNSETKEKLMFKIEKNVPVIGGSGPGRNPKYPFRDMEVGDSFAFSDDVYSKIAAASFAHGVKYGVKFSVSKVHGRCWRVA